MDDALPSHPGRGPPTGQCTTTTAGCGSGRAAILAAPTSAVGGPAVRRLVLALVAVSVVYGVLRKPLVAVAAWLVAVLPPSVLEWIPGRFVEELGE